MGLNKALRGSALFWLILVRDVEHPEIRNGKIKRELPATDTQVLAADPITHTSDGAHAGRRNGDLDIV